MKLYRIKISSWTASFKYPNLISGIQPTLEVPPISTVLGLINACAGRYLMHEQLDLGYYFDFGAKAVDLETIYQVELHKKGYPIDKMRSNVINREFLYDCRLFIYLNDSSLVDYFRKPYFQLFLGRSGDLATVESIEVVELEKVDCAEYARGQIIPFANNYLPGVIQALPKYFTDTIPRQNIGTEAYSVVSYHSRMEKTNLTAFRDVIDDQFVDIYMHKLNFDEYKG